MAVRLTCANRWICGTSLPLTTATCLAFLIFASNPLRLPSRRASRCARSVCLHWTSGGRLESLAHSSGHSLNSSITAMHIPVLSLYFACLVKHSHLATTVCTPAPPSGEIGSPELLNSMLLRRRCGWRCGSCHSSDFLVACLVAPRLRSSTPLLFAFHQVSIRRRFPRNSPA